MADTDVSQPAAVTPKPVHIGGESIADRLLPHLKKIIIGIVVLAVILSIYFGYRAYQRGKQEKQTAKLATVLNVAARGVKQPGMPEDPEEPPFTDVAARANAVLTEIAATGTDKASATFRGSLLLDAGKVDEAIAEYRKAERDKTIEGVLAREGLGIALETKALASTDAAAKQKGLEEALAAFTAMQPDEAGPRRAYALYHQARITETLGKRAEAKALFEKAKALTPPPELAELLEKRLANLGGS